MTVNVDWGNKNIIVPRTEMLLLQSTPVEIRQLDLTDFRYALHAAQESEAGMSYPDMHEHNFPVNVSGVELAQVVQIINGYTVTFEDGLYNVNIVGGNSNVSDKTVKNQVGVNTANSAGLQEATALQYASYGGVVTVDVVNGFAGRTYPVGNQEYPSNNIPDAVEIANKRGFKIIKVRGDLTLGAGDDVRGFTLIGASHVNSVLTIEPEALCLNTQFNSFDITGILDGNSEIRDCVVRDMTFFNGHIHYSSLAGTIIFGGNLTGSIDDCKMNNILQVPVLDCGGSGQNISMTNYSGRIIVKNLTGMSSVGIGCDAGDIIIDETCTSGIIALSGSGEVIDNSGPGCHVVDKLVDGSRLSNLQSTVEHLRDHHTGSGDVWYWDPINGQDWFDGKHKNRGFKTFAQAIATAKDRNNDTIICVAGNPTGPTIVDNEDIVINKDFILLRGPGIDFIIKAKDDNTDAINISGIGVEVSGIILETSATSTKNAIYSNGDFTLIKNVYIENSVDAITIDSSTYSIVDGARIHHNTGNAINVVGSAEHVDIINSHIGGNLNGININTANGHEVNINNCIVHRNNNYGVLISSTSSGVLIDNKTSIFSNLVGQIDDQGVGTVIIPTDANITAVTGTNVVDINDFKADTVTVNYPEIAQAVWEYAARTLTTTIFDTNIIKVNGTQVSSIDEFKADVSNLSADVNVIEVNGVAVTSIDDFKADLSGIDLSSVPQAVWEYVTRELTVAAGLTPEQEAKLDAIPTAAENATAVWEYNIPDFNDPNVYLPVFPQGRET